MSKSITGLGKGWERRHSIWMIWLLFPLGFTAFISFFVIGARAKEKKWLIAGFIYLLLLIQFFVVDEYIPYEHIVYDFSVMLLLGMWIAAWVQAVSVRPAYLRRLATRLYPEMNQVNSQQIIPKHVSRTKSSVQVKKYKPGRPTGKSEVSASEPKVINMNDASQEEIAALPSFDNIIASRVIEVRNQIGAFESMSHFIKEMNMKPHVIAKAKPYIVFSDETRRDAQKKEETVHSKYSAGRIVDY